MTKHRPRWRGVLAARSAGLTFAMLLGAAAPSTADSVVIVDHVKDVWHVDQGEDGMIYGYRKVGGAVNVNITSTTVRHRDHSVMISTEYRTLKKHDGLYYLFGGVRTDAPRKFDFDVTWYDSYPTDVLLGGLYERGPGEDVECENFSFDLDYAADTLRIVIPRRCLGTPETVSVRTRAFGRACCDDHKIDQFDRPGHGPAGWSQVVHSG